MDDILDVGCLVLVTMIPELQKQHEYMVAYEMIQNLKEILKSKYNNRGMRPLKLYFNENNELATDVILQSLSDNFNQFILNFNMNEIDKTLQQLLGMKEKEKEKSLRLMEIPNPKKKGCIEIRRRN
ncbi:hypothetical protein GQ457_05G023750 [Hibiscus cannabinus]